MSDSTALGLGLSMSHAQEQFSKAFVLAVAALAGCSAAEPDPDVDDIDWTLSCHPVAGRVRRPATRRRLRQDGRATLFPGELPEPGGG